MRSVLTGIGADPPGILWSWQGLVGLLIILAAIYCGRILAGKVASASPVATSGLLSVMAAVAWASCIALDASGLVFVALLVLGGWMVVARLGVFIALRMVVSPSKVSRLELAIGWILWAIVLLLLLQWLDPVVNVLDAIAIPFGKSRVSLLDAVRLAVVLLLFIGGATYLGALVERRVLVVAQLPIGLRVGIAKVSRVVLVVLAVVLGLNALGVDLTAMTVIGGAVGVGIGFGLQRIASNFVSGFVLLGDRSIRPGDVITIGTRFGVVRELRARYVVVRDRDGVDTLIPNENIITSEVVNWSYADRNIRLKVPVQISFRDNPRAAMALMEAAARSHPRVEREPSPASRVMGFAENGIDLELRFWIRDPEDGVNNVRSDIFLAIWDAFEAAGVTIPYPQRDVHFQGSAGPVRAPEQQA